MPGHKIIKKRVQTLEKMGEEEVARTYLEEGNVRSMMEALFDAHGDGKKPGVSAFYEWLQMREGRKEWWRQIRDIRAELDADEAVRVAMKATQDTWQRDRLEVQALQWRSGQRHKEYMEKTSVETLGQALMKALEMASRPEPNPIEADWERVDEDEDDD